ncbi:MAG: DUF2156 domain-containing protein [Candidatus Omnitrophica bacterium]|nr:DUF2156 domain-containing protein [Candidatus Omnitrophota bacterium]
MKILELKDKPIFEKYLNLKKHNLSTFSFANIFIWKDIFKIFWQVIDGALCIFMQDSIGCFMYLPPLGNKLDGNVINDCFSVMDRLNYNKDVSRIENVEKEDLEFYKPLRLNCKFKSDEYLYLKKDLISLSGNKYKSKRSAYNYFLKNYDFRYLNYNSKYKKECLQLYKNWLRQRKLKYKDSVYQKMLQDNYSTNLLALTHYKNLGLVGKIIKIDDKIKAYSLGFKLNNNTFCVLFEITDLKIKGLSQFIFREFAKELNGLHWVNIMDDSGLDNLKKVKISYRPARLEPSYLITRN